MPAYKRVAMNSGNVQMTAPPQMRLGKRDHLSFSNSALVSVHIFTVSVETTTLTIFKHSDSSRRSVIETSRSLKELFHEARERASKALGFAKMLRKVRDGSKELYLP